MLRDLFYNIEKQQLEAKGHSTKYVPRLPSKAILLKILSCQW